MTSLKVLYISSGDLMGSRFNGYDWHEELLKNGVSSKMLVGWNHTSKENWVDEIINSKKGSFGRIFSRTLHMFSSKDGLESQNFPWAEKIFSHPWYKSSDIVHLQIVHDGTLDFKSIKRIISEKPVVWTWHDFWPITGHCISPLDCNRWALGCGACPDLMKPLTIGKDRTKFMRQEKLNLINLDYSLHVTTNWFSKQIENDDYSSTPKPNVIPFGLGEIWEKNSDFVTLRNLLRIKDGNFVIGLRASGDPVKNLEIIKSALRILDPKLSLTIVTTQELGTLAEFANKFQVIDLGWLGKVPDLIDFYSVLDVFLMPSTQETFGLMSLEAMACGAPVVGLIDTAIDEICHLENFGYQIKENTGIALANALLSAIRDRECLGGKSLEGVNFVKQHYKMESFIESLLDLYRTTREDFESQ